MTGRVAEQAREKVRKLPSTDVKMSLEVQEAFNMASYAPSALAQGQQRRAGRMSRSHRAVVFASLVLLSSCAVDASLNPWPIDGAVLRPEAMFVEPARAPPGEIVAVTYVKPWDRGILYAIDTDLGGGWERRHLLISDANGARATWFAPVDENAVVDAIGVGGTGPDRVLIPEVTEPGDYRICTANAGDNICTPIEIGAP